MWAAIDFLGKFDTWSYIDKIDKIKNRCHIKDKKFKKDHILKMIDLRNRSYILILLYLIGT